MRMHLMLAGVAVLLVAAGEPRRDDLGRLGWKVPPNSRWVAVWGWKGTAKIEKALVTFRGPGQVTISWQARGKDGWCTCTDTYPYRSAPASFLGRLRRLGQVAGTVRPVGQRLRVEVDDLLFEPRSMHEPRGKLVLVLVQVK
jgi:hypothetical protein